MRLDENVDLSVHVFGTSGNLEKENKIIDCSEKLTINGRALIFFRYITIGATYVINIHFEPPRPRHINRTIHIRVVTDLDLAVVVGEVIQLVHLVVPDLELLELLRPRNHRQNVRLVHHRLHQLIEDLKQTSLLLNSQGKFDLVSHLDRVVLDVEVRRRAPEIGCVEVLGPLVEPNHLDFVQPPRGVDDNIPPVRGHKTSVLVL